MVSEVEVKQVEDIVYSILKRENILQKTSGQTTLDYSTDISIEEDVEKYMEKKAVAMWYPADTTFNGEHIHHNQLFIFKNGEFQNGNTSMIQKTLPFTFEEAVKVWELNSKGESLSTILAEGFKYSPQMSDIRLIIWLQQNGKCNWMLRHTYKDWFAFDFKKYIEKGKR